MLSMQDLQISCCSKKLINPEKCAKTDRKSRNSVSSRKLTNDTGSDVANGSKSTNLYRKTYGGYVERVM